jgi:FdhD protein
VISDPAQIEELELVTVPGGIEARMWVAPERLGLLDARRRRLAGATGCGLCGLESLAEAMRAPPSIVAETRFTPDQLVAAMAALPAAQSLNRQTHAVHAAGFWHPSAGLVAVREDVGRHNALDKLAGALARDRIAAASGLLVMTSRISVELVQKAARMGVPLLAAISVPTALALRTAEACGLTLVGIARGDQFEVFTHPWRIGQTVMTSGR